MVKEINYDFGFSVVIDDEPISVSQHDKSWVSLSTKQKFEFNKLSILPKMKTIKKDNFTSSQAEKIKNIQSWKSMSSAKVLNRIPPTDQHSTSARTKKC